MLCRMVLSKDVGTQWLVLLTVVNREGVYYISLMYPGLKL